MLHNCGRSLSQNAFVSLRCQCFCLAKIESVKGWLHTSTSLLEPAPDLSVQCWRAPLTWYVLCLCGCVFSSQLRTATYECQKQSFIYFQFKTQMQIQIIRAKSGGTVMYRNVFHAGWVIAKNHGVRGVYQGLGATWMRNTPANGIYFGLCSSLNKLRSTGTYESFGSDHTLLVVTLVQFHHRVL